MAKYKAVALLIAKNEALYLPEWLDFQKRIGFERVYFYDNESTDETPSVLASYSDFVEITPWPNVPGKPRQGPAYAHFLANFGDQTEWVMALDADEFLNLKKHDSIGEFLKDYSDVSAVGINWRIFGDNGCHGYAPGRITERFTRASLENFGPNHIPKTIARTTDLLEIGAHTPRLKEGKRYVGTDRRELLQYPKVRQESVSLEIAQVNHYFGKTWEEYEIKKARGLPSRAADSEKYRRTNEDFHFHNKNDVEDTSVLRFWSM